MEKFNNLDDFIQHHGIKGMKWGVRRKTPKKEMSSRVGKNAKRTKTLLDKANGLALPLPAAGALYLQDAVGNMRAKRRITKALKIKPRDVNKQDLRNAVATVRSFNDVTITVDNNTIRLKSS